MLQLEHDGRVFLGGRVWAADRMGLPGPEIELVVQSQGRLLGRFVMTPTPGYEISYERRVVAGRSPTKSAHPCDLCSGLACKKSLPRLAPEKDSMPLAYDQKQGHEEGVADDDHPA